MCIAVPTDLELLMINKRSINMKRVSATRSAEVKAMLDLLRELDKGGDGDLEGFNYYGIKHNLAMKNRINSYRAQKIANAIGKNISKSHLMKFSKDKDLMIVKDFTFKDEKKMSVNEFLDINIDALIKYYSVIKSFYINNALFELDNN